LSRLEKDDQEKQSAVWKRSPVEKKSGKETSTIRKLENELKKKKKGDISHLRVRAAGCPAN